MFYYKNMQEKSRLFENNGLESLFNVPFYPFFHAFYNECSVQVL